jgi:hypothetical protein
VILANPRDEEKLSGINADGSGLTILVQSTEIAYVVHNADDGRVHFARLTGTAIRSNLYSINPDRSGSATLAATTGCESPYLDPKELK